MIERLHRIIEGWYVFEGALFEVSLLHELRENPQLKCPMRCGAGRIEFNPSMLEQLSDECVEMLLKCECIRIILKHPYERQPVIADPIARLVASNMVIADNYPMRKINLPHSTDFGLPREKSFEWYAYNLMEHYGLLPGVISVIVPGIPCDDPAAVSGEATALWDEDVMMDVAIGDAIKRAENTNNWGTLPGDLVKTILASTVALVDFRRILSGFRASVLASNRSLTRMRPNRRTGFDNMGSLRRLSTRLLVAIDVSGSISDVALKTFLGVVNRAFRYGIEQLDLVTFDTEIHDVYEFRKARKKVKITGGGGTNFQPALDYAHIHGYDGLMILTDGLAPVPKMPPHARFKMAWVFDSQLHYEKYRESFRPLGRCLPIIS